MNKKIQEEDVEKIDQFRNMFVADAGTESDRDSDGSVYKTNRTNRTRPVGSDSDDSDDSDDDDDNENSKRQEDAKVYLGLYAYSLPLKQEEAPPSPKSPTTPRKSPPKPDFINQFKKYINNNYNNDNNNDNNIILEKELSKKLKQIGEKEQYRFHTCNNLFKYIVDDSVALNEELQNIYGSNNADIDKYFNSQGYHDDFEKKFKEKFKQIFPNNDNDEDKKTKLKLIYILHNEPL